MGISLKKCVNLYSLCCNSNAWLFEPQFFSIDSGLIIPRLALLIGDVVGLEYGDFESIGSDERFLRSSIFLQDFKVILDTDLQVKSNNVDGCVQLGAGMIFFAMIV